MFNLLSKTKLINKLQNYLPNIVYGATDGIITTFTIVSGIEGANLSPITAIVIGIISLFADGLSMGAANFLSMRADTIILFLYLLVRCFTFLPRELAIAAGNAFSLSIVI